MKFEVNGESWEAASIPEMIRVLIAYVNGDPMNGGQVSSVGGVSEAEVNQLIEAGRAHIEIRAQCEANNRLHDEIARWQAEVEKCHRTMDENLADFKRAVTAKQRTINKLRRDAKPQTKAITVGELVHKA